MKVNLQDQKTLLAIAEIDLALVKNGSDRKKLLESALVDDARQKLMAASDLLIDARNKTGDLELELKKAENDLELVESRIQKDKQRLSTTSSPKDAQGIEHELESLGKRKSDLEDLEINVLELLDLAKQDLEELTTAKQSAENELSQQSTAASEKSNQLQNEQEKLLAEHQQLLSTLVPEIAVLYQKKASRAVAVGKLIGRECGACRLSITATNLDEINALPADEIAECPNCQAILVR